MTISGFVGRAQRILGLTALVSALLVSLSAALVLMGVQAFISGGISAPVGLAVLIGVSVLLILIWRLRAVRSVKSVALWIEELIPTLDYAVVTSVGQLTPSEELEKSVSIDALQRHLTRRVATIVGRALLLFFASFALYLVSPATSFGRSRVQTALRTVFPGMVRSVHKVETLRVRVIPPAYTSQNPRDMINPASLSAISGSTIVLSGDGSPEGVSVLNDGAALKVRDSGNWTARMIVVKAVSVLRISHGDESRIIVIEAIPDRPPRVALIAPVRDTTLRTPRYSVLLEAESADDIGLVSGYFEYLIVSGSGESFAGRTVTTPVVNFASRLGRMTATLDFARLNIGTGDLVSVRAMALDNNLLSGPSVGVSDTRTFRVARADEYDSVSIEAAAPVPMDSSAMSQRMLILMTEALVKKQPTIARAQVVRESDDIGDMEDRIRKRVYDILYQQDSPEGVGDVEEAESEIHAITNRDLKTAYDALWDAVRSLRIGEPSAALPPMRIALKALDRARLAQRLYLRGSPPRIVVDIAHVRLTGKEKGSSSLRMTGAAADSSRRDLGFRFESALRLRQTNPRLMLDQLSLVRVRAIGSSPEFANALRDVIEAFQKERDPGLSLVRARKALTGTVERARFSVDWIGGG